MRSDDRGPVRARVCCAPFTLLRLLTLHCTRRRGAAEGEGAQQTGKGAADAKACRRRPGAVPRGPRATRSILMQTAGVGIGVYADPVRPGASAHETGFVATAGVLVGDIAQTPHAAPAGSGPGRPRSSGRDRFGARSAPPPRRPPPAALPEQPRRARPIPRGPTHRGGGRAVAREGLDGGDSSHRYGGDRHDARLLRGGRAPPGGNPAQGPRGGGRGPRSRPPRRRVRQPGSLVMSLLVCCRLVM